MTRLKTDRLKRWTDGGPWRRSVKVFVSRRVWTVLTFCLVTGASGPATAQFPNAMSGDPVPRDVRETYEKGLQFLASTQSEDGGWGEGGYAGPGVTGMAIMTFLASGEDPNYGIYSSHIRRGLRSILNSQDPETGILGGKSGHTSMYHHGFAMLALAEAYGAVDDRTLWTEVGEERGMSLGESLELAVRGAVTSQKNNKFGGWRYGPDAKDADTSVSGAVMVGLLAARNAGIDVPDEAIERGVSYFLSMTNERGNVSYSGPSSHGDSLARSSIATLVYAIGKRKEMPKYRAALESLTSRLDQAPPSYPRYTQYYEAQALFQGDPDAWRRWNDRLIRELKEEQMEDGQFTGSYGATVETSLGLLAMALNYRFLPIYER